MEEDEECFYDSLDEEPSKQKSDSIIKQIDNVLEHQSSEPSINSSKVQFQDCQELCKTEKTITKIPLYIGETNKEDIEFLIKQKQTATSLSCNKTSTSCVSIGTNNSLRRRNTKSKPLKSYWNIYCQKNNINMENESHKTNRSTYGGSTDRTFSSFISSCGLNGPVWDAPSVFEKYMPQKYANKLNDTFINEDVLSVQSSSCITSQCSQCPEIDNLKSISQMNVHSNQIGSKFSRVKSNIPTTVDSKRLIRNKSKSNELTIKLSKNKSNISNTSSKQLTLKKSAPDETKVNLLKKQQEYGIKASNRNRAKIIHNLKKNGDP